MQVHTCHWPQPPRPSLLRRIADATPGYAGADLAALATSAVLCCIRRQRPAALSGLEEVLETVATPVGAGDRGAGAEVGQQGDTRPIPVQPSGSPPQAEEWQGAAAGPHVPTGVAYADAQAAGAQEQQARNDPEEGPGAVVTSPSLPPAQPAPPLSRRPAGFAAALSDFVASLAEGAGVGAASNSAAPPAAAPTAAPPDLPHASPRSASPAAPPLAKRHRALSPGSDAAHEDATSEQQAAVQGDTASASPHTPAGRSAPDAVIQHQPVTQAPRSAGWLEGLRVQASDWRQALALAPPPASQREPATMIAAGQGGGHAGSAGGRIEAHAAAVSLPVVLQVRPGLPSIDWAYNALMATHQHNS